MYRDIAKFGSNVRDTIFPKFIRYVVSGYIILTQPRLCEVVQIFFNNKANKIMQFNYCVKNS